MSTCLPVEGGRPRVGWAPWKLQPAIPGNKCCGCCGWTFVWPGTTALTLLFCKSAFFRFLNREASLSKRSGWRLIGLEVSLASRISTHFLSPPRSWRRHDVNLFEGNLSSGWTLANLLRRCKTILPPGQQPIKIVKIIALAWRFTLESRTSGPHGHR